MLKVETSNINGINTTNTQETSNKKLAFLGKTDNKLEKIPSNDTFENKNKNNKKKIIVLSVLGTTIAAALVEGFAYKGKHINKFLKKAENKVKNETKPKEETTQEIKNEMTTMLSQAEEKLAKIKKITHRDIEERYPDGRLNYIKYIDKNGNEIGRTKFQDDGKTIESITECNQLGNKITYFQKDGKTINKIEEYGVFQDKTRTTLFQKDGTSFEKIEDYDVYGEKTKTIHFQNDGTSISKIEEYNVLGKNERTTYFQKDGKTVDKIGIYNNKGNLIQEIHYEEDGETIDYIQEFYANGNRI